MEKLGELQSLFMRSRIGRRQFIEGAVALGLSSIAATGFADRALASTPKKGGLFRWATPEGDTTDSLDPVTFVTIYQFIVDWQIRDNLTEVDPEGKLVPALAESRETTDGQNWAFHLRRGVEFHSGKSLTADDVVYSINLHRGENSKSSAKPVVQPIVDIKADDKQTVLVRLAQRNADFPFLMSDYHLPIVPAGASSADMTSIGDGTAGYKLKELRPGISARTIRNPNYWRDDRAHFDEIETLVITDVAARTTALTTGEIDAFLRPEIRTLNRLSAVAGIRIIESQGNAHDTFPMDMRAKPFSDNNVRMALKLAIDREALLKKVLGGHGYLGNDHPIGHANRYFNPDIAQRQQDPDKARWYLKQAGLDSLSVPLFIATVAFDGAVDAATLFKEDAKKSGIDIKMVVEPAQAYWDNDWLKKPFVGGNWNGRPTEDWMFTTVYAEGAPWNESHWSNKQFNDLLLAARAELDEAKRRQMYYEMQILVRDQGATIIPLFNNFMAAVSSKVQTAKVAANWEFDGYKAPERWWFA